MKKLFPLMIGAVALILVAVIFMKITATRIRATAPIIRGKSFFIAPAGWFEFLGSVYTGLMGRSKRFLPFRFLPGKIRRTRQLLPGHAPPFKGFFQAFQDPSPWHDDCF